MQFGHGKDEGNIEVIIKMAVFFSDFFKYVIVPMLKLGIK